MLQHIATGVFTFLIIVGILSLITVTVEALKWAKRRWL